MWWEGWIRVWEGWCVVRSEVCEWGGMDVDGGRVSCRWCR